jgi:hypothetical protein
MTYTIQSQEEINIKLNVMHKEIKTLINGLIDKEINFTMTNGILTINETFNGTIKLVNSFI